jgi:hypothetical protein
MSQYKKVDKLNDLDMSSLSVIEEDGSYKTLQKDELAIHLRIVYGGMEGDLKMLKDFRCLWKRRFINKLMDVDRTNINQPFR